MLLAFALALAANQFVPEDDLPLDLHGECIYPPAVVDAAGGAGLVLCDTVIAVEGGIVFRQRQWSADFHFFGAWHGDQLQVTSIQGRTGERVEARGLCRIYFAQDDISMISCTSIGGGRDWIANFRKSQI